jgi:hypothetical protein
MTPYVEAAATLVGQLKSPERMFDGNAHAIKCQTPRVLVSRADLLDTKKESLFTGGPDSCALHNNYDDDYDVPRTRRLGDVRSRYGGASRRAG